MSDTDNTDDLLVIPPDIFNVHSDIYNDAKSSICVRSSSTLDDLIIHVGPLEQISSCNVNEFICPPYLNVDNKNIWHDTQEESNVGVAPLLGYVGYNKMTQKEAISNALSRLNCEYSNNPIMCKNQSSFYVHNINSDGSSIVSAPSFNQDRLLTEIDNFLIKTVASFEREKCVRYSLQDDNMKTTMIHKHDNYCKCASIEYIAKNENVQQERNLFKNSTDNDSKMSQQFKSTKKDTIKVFDAVSLEESKEGNKKEIVNNKQDFFDLETSLTLLPKAPANATNTQISHDNYESNAKTNALIQNPYVETKRSNVPNFGSQEGIVILEGPAITFEKNIDENLIGAYVETNTGSIHSHISLDKLWNSEYGRYNMEKEAENLHREYCHQEIQLLQMKLLESQEKLTVALQIDKAKDDAINQLKIAWQRLAFNFEDKDRELRTLKCDIEKERSQLEHDKQHYLKCCDTLKIETHNSRELVKSLKENILVLENMLKEKIEENEAQNCELKMREQQFSDMLKEKNISIENNTELSNMIEKLRNELENECKHIISVETKHSNLSLDFDNKVSECSRLQEEINKLNNKMSIEQEKNLKLETLKRNFNNALDEIKLKENNLLYEVKSLRNQLENQKKDLKRFYQSQVETVVKEKMLEFQGQLEYAEKFLKEETQKKEHFFVERSNKQIQSIMQQNDLEINLLKDKHTEEIQLYELRLKNLSQQAFMLKEKLSSYYAKRDQIAKQLQRVMENQWQAALQIITSSPDHDIDMCMNQNILHSANLCNAVREEEPGVHMDEGIGKKNSQILCSTPIPTRDSTSKPELQTQSKQFLVQPPCSEKNYIPLDWPVLSQDIQYMGSYLNEKPISQNCVQKYYIRNAKPSWNES